MADMAEKGASGVAGPNASGVVDQNASGVAGQNASGVAEQRASGGRLLSGTLWNAAGRGLPLLLALALTPVLVHQMGLDRWGLFTLALALVGVFGVFDLGVGAALTRALSARIGAGET
ncbi:MAG: hypothetical protein K2X46_08705, partial [Roseomonas sp.]|nr:hypothetical protein [Roseomonas sp.]